MPCRVRERRVPSRKRGSVHINIQTAYYPTRVSLVRRINFTVSKSKEADLARWRVVTADARRLFPLLAPIVQ